MAEAGISVEILDGGEGPRPLGLDNSIQLHRPLRTLHVKGNTHLLVARQKTRLQRNALFRRTLLDLQKKRIELRICYDSPAISLAGLAKFPHSTFHHYHEYPEAYPPRWYLNLQHWLATRFSRHADLVIVPDDYRALALQEKKKLVPASVKVVPNCPRLMSSLPTGRLRTIVKDVHPNAQYIVLFQGAISENYYADQIVRSIKWWPDDAVMVFLGPVHTVTHQTLLNLAHSEQVADRILFLPQVAYMQLFHYTVDADLGMSMIRPVTFNFEHMAGASNKRYEFMACGIPQITNYGPGMQELIEENGIGMCVWPQSAQAIGMAVRHLLESELRRKAMGVKARNLHLIRYNYDMQFAPVLETIKRIVGKSQNG